MKNKRFESFLAWLFGAPSDPRNSEAHIRVGRRWLTATEYLNEQKPCDGAVRCPQAGDVTCEECEKVHEMDVKEALVCDSCAKASAYACERCLGGGV